MLKKQQSAIIAFFLLCASATNAQQIPFYDSGDLIKKGIEEHDKGNYKSAIELYKKVPEGDSNYLFSIYEQSLSQLEDSNFKESIRLANFALKQNYYERKQLLLNMGTAYHGLQDDAMALKIYDSVATLFPHDNRPFYERSVVYFTNKDYAAAEKALQKSLMLQPMHYRSHALLGNVYLLQGRLTEAMIALQSSLLCTNDINAARTPISLLGSIAKQTEEIANLYKNKKETFSHPVYDEIDEIVHAKLALDKNYALKSSVDDNITRQLQVVLEKLTYDRTDSNFVMQYYVPLLKQVYDNSLFENYILLLFSDYGIESVDKIASAKKGKTKLEDVRNVVFPYFSNIAATRVLMLDKREKTVEKYNHYLRDNMLIVGKFQDKETRKFAEGFVQFYEGGYLVAEGDYTAMSKKTGEWKYYYPTGILKLKEFYKDDKLTGETYAYYKNGSIESYVKFGEDEVVKERKEYEYNGDLESHSILKSKDEYEVTYYNEDGSIMRKINLVNDKVKDGKYTILFPNGKVDKEMEFKDQALNGPYTAYFEDGKLRESYTMREGKAEGVYTAYYNNGNLKTKYTIKNGKKEGNYTDYYENGVAHLRREMAGDKLNGAFEYLDKQGNAYGIVQLKNDKGISAQFKDKEGKVVYEKTDKQGLNPYEVYNASGIKITSLPQDEDGKITGKASYFFDFGVLREETNFKKDVMHGLSTNYAKNGKVSVERNYVEGMTDGYYKAFGSRGQVQAEGWFKEDKMVGVWHHNYSNGQVQRSYFMFNEKMNGPEKNYSLNGKLELINHYDNGVLVGFTQYDSTGKVIKEQELSKGNGRYTTLYFNGNTAFDIGVKNGRFQGPYTISGPAKEKLEEGNYLNGQKNGSYSSYYSNGKLRLKGNYTSGNKTGLWILYSEVGDVESETEFIDDEMSGVDKFYCGGQLRYETAYKNNLKDGMVKIYGEEKKLAGILYYDEGVLVGYSYENKDGQLLPMIPVIKATSAINTNYANGNKALEFNVKNNCYDGSQKLYYNNGQLAENRNFKNDNFEGGYLRFNPDGSKLLTSSFKNDEQQGVEEKYDKSGRLTMTTTYIDGIQHGKAQVIDAQGKDMKNLWYYYGSPQ